jgi:hypothetical protein
MNSAKALPAKPEELSIRIQSLSLCGRVLLFLGNFGGARCYTSFKNDFVWKKKPLSVRGGASIGIIWPLIL